MTTTDQHTPDPDLAEVILLGRKPQAPPLLRLLEIRGDLAKLAAEWTAHNVPGAERVSYQVLIENQIQEHYPHVYDEQLSEWVLRDAQLMHTAEVMHTQCRICTGTNIIWGDEGDIPA